MWWKEHKWKVLAPILILAVLAGAFWYGGGAPGLRGWTVNEPSLKITQEETPQDDVQEDEESQKNPTDSDNPTDSENPKGLENSQGSESPADSQKEKGDLEGASKTTQSDGANAPKKDKEYSQSQGMEINPSTGKDQYLTDPVPEGKPLPVEPQNVTVSDKAYTCTLSISCASIRKHMDWLSAEKAELVPEDGWILPPTAVTFYEGESVFNVLQRTCKQKKIHMEFENTPMYNSAYIEGIHNLYEFDCGELSGWMYKVNEWFPNYGCSRYQLKDGDVICWVYTCDLGADVGGFYSTGS